MQLEWQFQQTQQPVEMLATPDRAAPPPAQNLSFLYVKNPRARRYILRVRSDGSVRVTIPRGGNQTFARDFAQRHTAWIQKQIQNRRPQTPQVWTHGTSILFRGEPAEIQLDRAQKLIRFADQIIPLLEPFANVRFTVQAHLWNLAQIELPARTLELAALCQIPFRRVSIRNQRSRWGSCSVKGTVSLNWRLIQTPPAVRDYLILHELMHLRQMNHSTKFWNLVQEACPDYITAEKWLNRHNDLLR